MKHVGPGIFLACMAPFAADAEDSALPDPLEAGKQVDLPLPYHFLDRKNAPSDLLVTLFPVKRSQRCVIFSKQISVVILQQKPI